MITKYKVALYSQVGRLGRAKARSDAKAVIGRSWQPYVGSRVSLPRTQQRATHCRYSRLAILATHCRSLGTTACKQQSDVPRSEQQLLNIEYNPGDACNPTFVFSR